MEHEKKHIKQNVNPENNGSKQQLDIQRDIVYKIFFHEIYFPHSTFRVSSKVHMSHYLSLSLSGTG